MSAALIVCADCGAGKARDQFLCGGPKRPVIARLATRCADCRKACYYNKGYNRLRGAEHYALNRESRLAYEREKRESDMPGTLVKQAKGRAKRLGLPFNLTRSDVSIPDVCPVLGIPLRVNHGKCGADSPSLDRIVPELGYVVGNVAVISHRANTIKNDASPDELRAILRYYESA